MTRTHKILSSIMTIVDIGLLYAMAWVESVKTYAWWHVPSVMVFYAAIIVTVMFMGYWFVED